jgi:hypothetical protein
MTTDNPYGIDPASLPPELIEDINVITKNVDNVVQYHSSRERLRQFITPPPECGWQPEGVTQAADTLRAYGASTSAEHLLVKVRCTLPAGHHECAGAVLDPKLYDPCCNREAAHPIHCGDEHRIDKWVKP